MKRIFLTAVAASLMALIVPGAASAHHAKRHAHHANTHRRHHRHAHLVRFGTPLVTPTTPTTPTPPPTPPTTPTGETAGTVASFTEGVLTIKLNDGTMVSGKVTEQTELECQAATPPPTTAGGEDQGSGDDQQSSTESGEHGTPSSQPGMQQHDGGQTTGGHDGEGDQSDDDAQQVQGCTTAALVPGAVVREAELSVGNGGAVWEKVELQQ